MTVHFYKLLIICILATMNFAKQSARHISARDGTYSFEDGL